MARPQNRGTDRRAARPARELPQDKS